MTINTLPTAAEVRTETGLRKEQVGGGYATVDALETYIADSIIAYVAPDVEMQIEDAEDSARKQLLATRAVKEAAKAELLRNSGQLDEAYTNKATAFQANADRLIALINTADAVLDESGNEVAIVGAVTLTRTDGYSSSDPEYSCSRGLWWS